MTERGSVRGTTTCPKNLTAMLTITDSSTGQTAHRATCQGSGFKAASCSTSQSVTYFSSAILTRPVSTVVFKYQLFTGTQERMCFEYKVNMVGGTEGTHGAGPCGGSTI